MSGGLDKIAPRVAVRTGARQRIHPTPVVIDGFLSDARGQHQVQVPEHLPDHEQRLLADDRLRPQVSTDRKCAGGSPLEDPNDSLTAPTVLRQLAPDDVAWRVDRR